MFSGPKCFEDFFTATMKRLEKDGRNGGGKMMRKNRGEIGKDKWKRKRGMVGMERWLMRYILVTETEGRFKWTSSDEEECLDRYTYNKPIYY